MRPPSSQKGDLSVTKHLETSVGALFVWLGLAGASGAATLSVPDGHPSIQLAMQAAFAGDTVLVRPGTYSELIQMKGGVILKSSAGPDSTILRSPGISKTAVDERVLECRMGVDRSTIIEGFTFESTDIRGAGIYCEYASPTIRNNVIRRFGWGMNLRFSDALVEDNVVSGCSPFGILIFASSPELRRNTLSDNQPQAISIAGKKSKPIIGGRREFANRIYGGEVAIVNESRNGINATWNDWGWAVGAEMERKGFPADIYAFVDGNDQTRGRPGVGKIDYRHWIKAAK